MKQAIEEGFIMDVLRHFTPVQSYYKLAKTIEDDPKFDKKRAQRLLRYYVESNQYAIHEKANIMVSSVISSGQMKIKSKSRSTILSKVSAEMRSTIMRCSSLTSRMPVMKVIVLLMKRS